MRTRAYDRNATRGSRRTRALISIAALISILTLSSCAKINRCGFHAFTEKADWVGYQQVAIEKQTVFRPDQWNKPTQFGAMADRIDYLEAYGVSVNAAIGLDEN